MNNNQSFVIERVYNASIDKVWKAISDKAEMKQWYFDLEEFKPEVGFEFQFYGEGKTGEKFLHLCKITHAVKNKKLRYSCRYDRYEGISFVTFELFEEGKQTRLKLTHEGLETFPVTANNDFAKENFAEGWTYIIGKSLPEYLSAGSGGEKN
ncbi:MAG TPA: SRPBCC domain-containing protein [Chitinophagaceae bacterium]|nr:SRPBCC domain-containing protein [Chitinophagaceae bacterium]